LGTTGICDGQSSRITCGINGLTTDDEKVRIVEESHRDGETVAEVARRHEVSRSQLYDWRYRYKHGLLGVSGAPFLRLVPVEAMPGSNDDARSSSPAMTIDLGARCRVTVPADFDMEAVARLLNGLGVTR
jgi:transposase